MVYAGENDLAAGQSVDQVVASFTALQGQVRERLPDTPLIFLALKPSPRRQELLGKFREANQRIAELCANAPHTTFVDVFAPLLGQDGQPRAELFGPDRLHLSAAGYETWTQVLGPILSQLKPGTASGNWIRIHHDDFSRGLERWRVEQTQGGTVTAEDGKLIINDANGCTVWFRSRLQAPVRIRYTATASSRARVSDLNCFWMATDPREPDDLFHAGHSRDGTFASYDSLRTYYVGYGGNANTTTRFRRYDGTGARPLEPEHDLQSEPFLLKPDHTYQIELIVDGDRVQYLRDGEVVFNYTDREPLTSGWFGFRTVRSRLEIDDFEVWSAPTR